MSRLGVHLERVVDLGFSWISPFSKVLLRVMVWLHALMRNYGLAIIFTASTMPFRAPRM